MLALLPKFLTLKKLIFLFLFSCFFFLVSSKPLHAFETKGFYQFQFEQAITSPEMNLQSFVYETLKASAGSVVMTVAGCFTCPPEKRETGMIQTISSLIAILYTTPPASGVEYLADLGKQIGIVQPVHAQETGFEKLKPYLDIWKAFRDLTYIFFVLIFVFMGFAIMFRVKISPQVIITIQSALPKLVIGLILVTFSYAIVGFLVDLMFVVVNIVLFALGKPAGFTDIINLIPTIHPPITSDWKAIGTIFFAGLFPSVMILALFAFILPAAWTPFTLGLSFLAGPIFGSLIMIILAIVFLIAMIRVFWSLLKAYVMVVINLIFAPFQILIGVLPGSNAIGSWFRNLIANLAVFPATLAMLLLSYYLVYYVFNKLFLWDLVRKLISDPNYGMAGFIKDIPARIGETPELTILSFISLGILLITPKVSDMIKSFFAGKPFEYGVAIGEVIGPTGWGIALGTGPVTERLTRGMPATTRDTIRAVAQEFAKLAARGFRSSK